MPCRNCEESGFSEGLPLALVREVRGKSSLDVPSNGYFHPPHTELALITAMSNFDQTCEQC
jgi:hypothetical protein